MSRVAMELEADTNPCAPAERDASMDPPGAPATYGVFVRFRQKRLALRRGIPCIEDAVAIAEALRAERLHGRDDVFVARERDGEAVTAADEPTDPAWQREARDALDRATRAKERAAIAAKRLDRAARAIAAVVARGDAPPVFARLHRNAEAARALSAEAHASFVRAMSRVEAWLGSIEHETRAR
jgi:hypothetical protein